MNQQLTDRLTVRNQLIKEIAELDRMGLAKLRDRKQAQLESLNRDLSRYFGVKG